MEAKIKTRHFFKKIWILIKFLQNINSEISEKLINRKYRNAL